MDETYEVLFKTVKEFFITRSHVVNGLNEFQAIPLIGISLFLFKKDYEVKYLFI
jgi:hypothetical protein